MNKIFLPLIISSLVSSLQLYAQNTGCIEGNCENGKGTYIYDDGTKYSGDWKKGWRDGVGMYWRANGDIYNGDWKSDYMTGEGSYTFADGRKCSGPFKSGGLHGLCTFTFTNGTQVTHQWKNDVQQAGACKIVLSNGQTFEGNIKFSPNKKRGWVKCESGFVIVGDDGSAYIGPVKSDNPQVPHGQGTYIYPNGDVYVGSFVDNYMEGQGTLTSKNGDVYTGTFAFDGKDGKGTLVTAEGVTKIQVYNGVGKLVSSFILGKTGCISGNCENGVGTFLYESGEKFTGPFEEGKRAGQGTFVTADGTSRSEDWEGDKRIAYYEPGKGCITGNCNNGTGTFVNENGSSYSGTFKQRLQDGQGTLTLKNGTKVIQQWNEGRLISMSIPGKTGCIEGNCKDGTGTFATLVSIFNEELTYSKYVGEWKLDKKNGKGKLTFESGDVYEGDFKNDIIEGTGTYTYQTGEKHTGEFKNGICLIGTGYIRVPVPFAHERYASLTGSWKNDKIISKGKYTFVNGDVFEGEFKNNILYGPGTFTDEPGGGLGFDFEATGVMHYANGDRYEGEYEYGQFTKGTLFIKQTGEVRTTKEMNKEAREIAREENQEKRQARAAEKEKKYKELLERDKNSCPRCEGVGRIPMNEVFVLDGTKMVRRAASIHDGGKRCPVCDGTGQKKQ